MTSEYRLVPTRRPPQGKNIQSGFLRSRDFTGSATAAVDEANAMALEIGYPVLVRQRDAHGILSSSVGVFDGGRKVRTDRGVRRG